MYNQYNLASKLKSIFIYQKETREAFFGYLIGLSLSPKSLKNYKSDLNNFMNWITNKEFLEEDGLSAEVGVVYRDSLLSAGGGIKTINRRLSTLRHFSKYLMDFQILNFNFMSGVENINVSKRKQIAPHSSLSKFKAYLSSQGVSQNTIKNYLSDISQFLSWRHQKSNE